MKIRLVALMLLMTCVATVDTAARGQGTTSTGERFTTYVQPTGAEITPQAASEKAIQHVFDTEGDRTSSLSTTVEVAHSNYAAAIAVQEGQKVAEAQTIGSDAEQTEMRQSTVYLVAMRGAFFPLVPTPRGRPQPQGNIFSMVVNAHTGWIMSEQLGGEPPKMAELGPVTMLTVGTTSGVATTARRLNPKVGMLLGTVYQNKSPAAGWRTVVRSGRRTMTKHTGPQGGFYYQLPPGKYTVSAYRPGGKLCDKRTEKIKRRHNTYVTLQCK